MRLAAAALLAAPAASPAAAAPKPFAFAPYVHANDGIDLAGWAKATGGRYLSLAFYNAAGGQCRGAWPIDEARLLAEVGRLRALGGDVIVSSGGWNADDLAARCPTPEALADVYEGVLKRFAADHLDLDPEPGDVHDNLKPEVVDRRSAAAAILQKRFAARGRRLRVSFTIAVRPSFGFDPANLYVLQSALAARRGDRRGQPDDHGLPRRHGRGRGTHGAAVADGAGEGPRPAQDALSQAIGPPALGHDGRHPDDRPERRRARDLHASTTPARSRSSPAGKA